MVSSIATTCPGCGHPLRGKPPAPRAAETRVTIADGFHMGIGIFFAGLTLSFVFGAAGFFLFAILTVVGLGVGG